MLTKKWTAVLATALLVVAGSSYSVSAMARPAGGGGGSEPLPLSVDEEAGLQFMREEEKLARDVYLNMYELWGAEIFANISESEQRHMDAVGRLITRYGLTDPIGVDEIGVFENTALTEAYGDLMIRGSESLEAALQVGVDIEELDIADLEEALKEVSMRSIQRVFNNLLDGSENHFAAFQNAIETGITDCPVQDGTGLGAGQGGTCRQDCDGSMTPQGGQGAGSNGNGDGVCLQ